VAEKLSKSRKQQIRRYLEVVIVFQINGPDKMGSHPVFKAISRDHGY
jgi:hypothetical protein